MRFHFMGLVAHVTLNIGTPQEIQLAVLPAAQDHVATLTVPTVLVDDDPDGIGKNDQTGNYTCFPLSGCVKFPVLGSGALKSDLAAAEVPSLRVVTSGGSLTSEITKCPPDANVLRSVIYLPPAGRLMPEEYFTYEVDFNHVYHGPLPRLVAYLVATSEDTVELDIYGHKVVIKSLAEPVIAHVCKDSQGDHFQNYKLLFDPPAAVVYDPDDSAKRPCTFGSVGQPLPSCATVADLNVDCSNSHFP